MGFASLLRSDGRVIGYGFAYAFGSSVGQTFFISLFIPGIAASLATGEAVLATIYGAATLASAAVLPSLGRLIDRVDLVKYGLAVALALMAGCLVVAAATHPVMVLAGMFALRLFGQGLMSHTALTGAARYFKRDRGKALSLTGLGHAAGEGVLPLLVVAAIALVGWRTTYAVSGLVVGLALAPAAALVVWRNRRYREPVSTGAGAQRPARRSGLLWRADFWLYLPLLLMSPFTVTALIFHHGLISSAVDVPMTVFAAGFVGFALVQIPASLIAGPLIDRFGSRGPLMLHLLPMAAGVALLAAVASPWSVAVYLLLAGATNAAGAILRTSMIAEMVNSAYLGAARSLVTAFMVVSTAAGPAVYSGLMALGVEVRGVLWIAVGMLMLAAVPALAAGIYVAMQQGRR